ncbi:MAG: DUF814 domain-containing protein [Myxococcales bacterium]|nr:DUF814 domain-containing protein [Myxococcales bacterium]
MTPVAELVGARIERVDLPRATELYVTLRRPNAARLECLVLSFAPVGPAMWLAPTRPRGDTAPPSITKVRHHWVGARVGSMEQVEPHVLEMTVERSGAASKLRMEWSVRGARALFTLSGDRPLAKLELDPGGAPRAIAIDSLPGPPDTTGTSSEGEVEFLRRTLRERLLRDVAKLEKRARAVEGDLERSADSATIRQRADLLLANIAMVSKGATSVEVTDWSLDPPALVTLELDRRLDAKAQIEALYQRARRMDRGRPIAAERLAETRAAIASLGQKLTQIAEATTLEALRSLDVARGRAPTGASATTRRAKVPSRQPFREFVGTGNVTILVGRGAKDNDSLTVRIAKAHDLWLHVRDTTGAHVIVQLDRSGECPSDVLVDAAHLAVHFSERRDEPTVDVSYTPRRYVRKPKGAAPGAVLVDREKVLALRVEPARLARLLASEIKRDTP